jgi:hypothetical protein
LQATSLMPYLSYHRVTRNLKWLTNPFQLIVLLHSVVIGWCVYVVLFYLIAWTESNMYCWEKYKIFNYSKRQVTLHLNA